MGQSLMKRYHPLSKFLPYYNYQFPINNNLRWKPSRHTTFNQGENYCWDALEKDANITGGIFVEQAQPYSNDDRTSDKPQNERAILQNSSTILIQIVKLMKDTEIMCHRLQETTETDAVSAGEVLDRVLG